MRKNKLLLTVMVLVLAVAMLAGCNGGGTTGNNGESGYTMQKEAGTDGKITKDPLELTIFLHMGGLGAFEDDFPIFQKAAEMTNIKLHGVASGNNTDRTQEYNIMLTNNPLPDIVQAMITEINRDAMEGAYLPLDDLIDEYAPNIKKVFDENPDVKAATAAADGHIYLIPNMFDGVPSEGFYIRQDWLDKLSLEMPKTVDEYYNVLKAFKEQDPNGNGIADEVPYFTRMATIDGLIQLWDAYWNWHDRDGVVVHGKAELQYKEAMQNLAKWYAEGLIDKEIFTRGNTAREQLLGDNIGGSTHDWFTSCGSFNKLSSQIPGFEWVAMAPPADVNGVVKEIAHREKVNVYGWGISKDNKYPVETIKYLDFWMSEEGQMLFSWGIEGEDYTMVNGKPVPTDAVLNAPESAPVYMRNRGQHEIGSISRIEGELEKMNEFSRAGYEMYMNNGYCEKVPFWPPLTLTQEELRITKEKGTAIDTYIKEQQQKWLMGTEELTDASWDSYLAQLKQMGMDDYTKVYADAYARYQSVSK